MPPADLVDRRFEAVQPIVAIEQGRQVGRDAVNQPVGAYPDQAEPRRAVDLAGQQVASGAASWPEAIAPLSRHRIAVAVTGPYPGRSGGHSQAAPRMPLASP
jgi:hypothetical protein